MLHNSIKLSPIWTDTYNGTELSIGRYQLKSGTTSKYKIFTKF